MLIYKKVMFGGFSLRSGEIKKKRLRERKNLFMQYRNIFCWWINNHIIYYQEPFVLISFLIDKK